MMHRTGESVIDLGRLSLISTALTSGLDPVEVAQIAVQQSIAGLCAAGGAIVLLHGEMVEPLLTVGYSEELVQRFSPLPLTSPFPLTEAIAHSEAVWVSSLDDARNRYPTLVAADTMQTNAWACVPLIADGEAFGAIGLTFDDAQNFSEAERLYLRHIADLAAIALRRQAAPTSTTRDERSTPSTEQLLPEDDGFSVRSGPLDDTSALDIFEFAPDGIMVIDEVGTVLFANRRTLDLFGLDEDSVIDITVDDIVPARMRQWHRRESKRYFDAPAVMSVAPGMHLYGRHLDGSEFPIELTVSPLHTSTRTLAIVAVRDVRQQRFAERGVTMALERNQRLLGELHQRVTQRLGAANAILETVQRTSGLPDLVDEGLDTVIETLQASLTDLREANLWKVGYDRGPRTVVLRPLSADD